MWTSTDRQHDVQPFARLKSEFSTGFMRSKFATHSTHSQTVLTTWCNGLTDPTTIRLDLKRWKSRFQNFQCNTTRRLTFPQKTATKNNSVLVVAIHIQLTSGIIMFQGTGYKLWAQKEFPELKKLVDLSCNNVTQLDGSISRVEQISFEQENE